MKNTRYILLHLVCALSFVLQGCVEEEWGEYDPTPSDKSTVTIGVVSGGVATRSANLSELVEDYTIATLRVFVLGASGAVENNEFTDEIPAYTDEGLFYSFDVVRAAKKSLYVVVNEPSSLSEKLSSIKHKSELATLNYQIAEALNNETFVAGGSLSPTNELIPMCAVQSVDASDDCDIVVYVDRVVARVDLYVDKDEQAHTQNVEFNNQTSVSVSGLYYQSSLFEPELLPTPIYSQLNSVSGVELSRSTLLKLEEDSRTSAQHLLSFYMAERSYNIDPSDPDENRVAINIDNVVVDGAVKSINSTILLGNNVKPYLQEINRNFVYRIFATYKGEKQSLEVSNEYAIEDWTIVDVDGNIEGVMVAMPNQVVMDWMALNSSFTAKDVSFGSNRAVEFYVPTTYDEVRGEYNYTKCGFASQAGAEYDLRNLSLYGVADDDNFIRSIPWLTEAKIYFATAQTGHFKFTYKLGNTPNSLDKFSLKVVSANVHKTMEVLYDNGYVPGELLQANDKVGCWGEAKSGIIFAKRGDALHPLINKDVLYYNSAGLYEGDITIEANAADLYCKDQLGPKWYAPNKQQLADIQSHVLELGTSYRYNNAPNSYYWSSESDAANSANYWAIDFTRGLTAPPAVSVPWATEYYVRCITNL